VPKKKRSEKEKKILRKRKKVPKVINDAGEHMEEMSEAIAFIARLKARRAKL
jgi:hypothetical protein